MRVDELGDGNSPQVLGFLKNVKYNKFNGWGVEHNTDTVLFLKRLIDSSIDSGIVFACYQNNDIIALLAFNKSPWDTDFFGINSGSIDGLWVDATVSNQVAENAVRALMVQFKSYAASIHLEFCFTSVDSWAGTISKVIQEFNFNYVLTWEDCFLNKKQEPKLKEGYQIGEIYSDELEYIMGLSKDYFKGGRFYLDTNFPGEKADQLYHDLIVNSNDDPTCELAVLRYHDDPMGAFICKEIKYSFSKEFVVRSLRLLVFDGTKSSPGLTTAYIGDVANYLFDKYNCDLVASGVEIHNLPSSVVHNRAGYKFYYTHNAYHWWAENE